MQLTIQEILDRIDIVEFVTNRYGLELKKQGNEYKSICCFHQEKTPSLTFTPSNQTYYCFGCGAGGDALTFVKEHESVSDKDAVGVLKGYLGIDDDKPIESQPIHKPIERPHDPLDDWQVVTPHPAHAPRLMNSGRTIPVLNPKTGKETEWKPEPDGVYPYKDHNKILLGAVLRVFIDGKKLTPTITYCANVKTGEERWIMKGFAEPKPIYGIDQWSGHDEVLVVEGERCCDSAYNALQGLYDVCSWPNGTNAVDKVDWSPLYGCKVVLWADNDLKEYSKGKNEGKLKPENEQNGRKAMLWLKKHLESNGSTVTLLNQPINRADGWDCADAVDEGIDLAQYIVDHTPEVEQHSDDEDDTLSDRVSNAVEDIVCLGYNDGKFYYYSKFTRQIRMLKDSSHQAKQLLGLAPIEWWDSKFGEDDPGKPPKPRWDEAASYLMEKCRRSGIFDQKRLRGRGCWMDGGQFVMHLGDRLIVDGETTDLNVFKSSYVYQAHGRKKAPVNALSNDDAGMLIEVAKQFDWEMPASAALLAGWCVLAPVCGALSWRPHIWLNGGSGSGKSTIVEQFVRQLAGDMGVFISLNSTVAGLRQTLNGDAFPVVIEEFDPKTKGSYDKAQEYFDMMRDASDDTDTAVLRGSTSGDAMQYTSNSMFCLAGIQVCTNEQAILNRTAVLSLKSRPNKTAKQKQQNEEQWALIQSSIDTIINQADDLSSRLLARTIGMIGVIQENIKVFKKAAGRHFGNQRNADQYGTLLAGAYSLTSDCVLREETALKYIQCYDWTSYTEDAEEDESMACLSSILQHSLEVRSTTGWSTKLLIREAIESVHKKEGEWEIINQQLLRFGIRCEDSGFIVANKSEAISLAMTGKPWGQNWGKYLKRITNDQGDHCQPTKNAVTFAFGKARGTIIEYGIIFDEEETEEELF